MSKILTDAQKTALAFLFGDEGAVARDGLSALEIADVIVGVYREQVAAAAQS